MSPSSSNTALGANEYDTAQSISRLRSRTRETEPTLDSSVPLVPQDSENLIPPKGPLGEEVAELLQEFVHPYHTAEETLVGGVERGRKQDEAVDTKIPWWKTPSPWWFLVVIPFYAMAMSSVMAPRIEIYTQLACEVHGPKSMVPEIDHGAILSNLLHDGFTHILSPNGDEQGDICASDPVVQAAAAKLNMVYTTSMGIFVCLTTAGWGSLSDRYGRTRILGVAVIGLLFSDISVISVTKFWRSLPGGYWFFLAGAFVEGGSGGLPAAAAGIHAYIADCTDVSNRSHFFSLFMGLLFLGMALGPTLGGFLVRYTGSLLVPFYFATCMHLLYAISLLVIVPESLTRETMKDNRNLHPAEVEQTRLADSGRPILARFKFIFESLSPLTLFLSPPNRKGGNPMKPKKDWSLLLIALSYGGAVMLIGAYNYIFQYTSSVFGWKSEQIGYWLSTLGFTRAVFLIAILPVIIKLFKPKPPPVQLPVEQTEPLHHEEHITSGTTRIKPLSPHDLHSLYFDLGVARVALILDITAFLLLPTARHPLVFTAYSMIGCMGTAFSPAIQSVGMGLYTQQGGTETGKLFGALSVMSALCSQILGPALFGLTFMRTVATTPTGIFYLAAAAVTFSFICVILVRIPKENELVRDEEETLLGDNSPEVEREQTLVDTQVPEILVEEDRNRKGLTP